jgi:hypothetical protein
VLNPRGDAISSKSTRGSCSEGATWRSAAFIWLYHAWAQAW